jgi:ABC-type multidrug transport system ATPase subunit
MLDEPTSGLDSFMARSICKLLQDLAHNKYKTVISTIHQPSSQAFKFFDRLILMADGKIVYQGLAFDAADYFSNLGFKSSRFSNPADIFMKVLAV